jgi:hypothetical protein
MAAKSGRLEFAVFGETSHLVYNYIIKAALQAAWILALRAFIFSYLSLI